MQDMIHCKYTELNRKRMLSYFNTSSTGVTSLKKLV